MIAIQIADETTGRKGTHTWTLEFLDETISAQELIRRRVYQEVQDFNIKQPERYRGLVEPTDAERDLNGFKVKPGRKIDWESQVSSCWWTTRKLKPWKKPFTCAKAQPSRS
jgi:hypothetical protein